MSKPKKHSHSSSSTSASTADFLKADDILQAVLLADSFTHTFRPVTLERPKVLLPVINVAMIDYALELLLAAGVHELFIFCCSHVEQIRSHLAAHRVLKRAQSLQYKVIESKECYSAGDALRYLDSLDIIKADFILMSGDTISNINLSAIVKQHKQRVKQDKSTLMTIIMKPAAAQHRIRTLDDDTIITLDTQTQQLLHYHNSFSAPHIPLPTTHTFSTHQRVCVHYNLYDTYVDICTPEVLLIMNDNFDYQDLRKDFIPGILGQEDIMNKHIYMHTLQGQQYAARIHDLYVYHSVSQDIIHRWVYPYVPDNSLVGNDTNYKYHRSNRYREDELSIDRTASIGDDTVIGKRSSIGEQSSIQNTVIGRECVIGRRVNIRGSYLWNQVVIEDDVTIEGAILCDGVVVKRGAIISQRERSHTLLNCMYRLYWYP